MARSDKQSAPLLAFKLFDAYDGTLSAILERSNVVMSRREAAVAAS